MDRIDREFSVRRLAAVDMHGATGTAFRRRLVTAEFAIGAIGGIAFGLWLTLTSSGPVGILFGLYLIGLGANYVPLAITTIRLRSPADLRSELRGVDIGAELHHYTATQFLVFVPGLLAYLAVRPASTGRRRPK